MAVSPEMATDPPNTSSFAASLAVSFFRSSQTSGSMLTG
jgi:hypothetical protein